MKIGKYEFGFAPVSMITIFIVLSVIAVLSAINQAKSEWPMPLSSLLIINESMALLATLVYGIILHLISAIISWIRARKE